MKKIKNLKKRKKKGKRRRGEEKKREFFLKQPPPGILLAFKNLKKYAKGEVVDLLTLDEEKEYTCKFYPEDVDPEWNDDSDDFPFK